MPLERPLTPQQIATALDAILADIASADACDEDNFGARYFRELVEWKLQLAFTKLLTLTESLELPLLRSDISRDFETAKTSGISEVEPDVKGNPNLKWAAQAYCYANTLQSIFAPEPSRTVTRDLESILRASAYSITDRRVFGSPPQNEAEVHLRLEAVLRCVFPDLKHKPVLTKPIKNFEPDTGIPSIHTLLEYKFLSSTTNGPQVADELLADTRGYFSHDWSSFVYVIYETQRFRAESEWRQLLRECGIGTDTVVVVLSGEPPLVGKTRRHKG